MEINVKRDGTRSVVYVSGDIDLYTSPKLRETVLDLYRKRGQTIVIVNLNEVHYIDSSGIASLVEALQAAHNIGATLGLVALSTQALRVFELARLDKVFPIYPDMPTAMSA